MSRSKISDHLPNPKQLNQISINDACQNKNKNTLIICIHSCYANFAFIITIIDPQTKTHLPKELETIKLNDGLNPQTFFESLRSI